MENKNEYRTVPYIGPRGEPVELPDEHELCEYQRAYGHEHCNERATEICDTCGAMLCNAHTVIGETVTVDGMDIPYTYCSTVRCVHGIRRETMNANR